MAVVDLDPAAPGLDARLREALARLEPGTLVRLRLTAEPGPEAAELLRAGSLRALAPAGTTVSVAWRSARVGGI
jgi:hypothetical protein